MVNIKTLIIKLEHLTVEYNPDQKFESLILSATLKIPFH